MEDGSKPVFPIERSIITLFDVPMCAAFSLTDYKTQAQTFSEALLDLVSKGRDSHREFCSFYVKLGRLTSSERLHLLENIQMSDISKKPHPDLIAEMARLKALEQTLARWHADTMSICEMGPCSFVDSIISSYHRFQL